MKPMFFIAGLFVLTAAFTLLSSCNGENSDETTLSGAQSCLDKASTGPAADACVAQLGTLRSPEAYSIICAAHFIAQGFTTTRFVSAYNALSTSGSGTNPTTAALAVMSFSNTTGTDGSVQTLSDCQASGVTSLTQLAVLAQMATLVGNVAATLLPAGTTISPTGYTSDQINAALAAFGNSGDPASLGSTAITANQVYCAAGSTYSTTSICTTLSAAINGGQTPTQIGTALIAQLQTTPH